MTDRDITFTRIMIYTLDFEQFKEDMEENHPELTKKQVKAIWMQMLEDTDGRVDEDDNIDADHDEFEGMMRDKKEEAMDKLKIKID